MRVQTRPRPPLVLAESNVLLDVVVGIAFSDRPTTHDLREFLQNLMPEPPMVYCLMVSLPFGPTGPFQQQREFV